MELATVQEIIHTERTNATTICHPERSEGPLHLAAGEGCPALCAFRQWAGRPRSRREDGVYAWKHRRGGPSQASEPKPCCGRRKSAPFCQQRVVHLPSESGVLAQPAGVEGHPETSSRSTSLFS